MSINSESMFPSLCASAGLPVPVAEFKFHPSRKWRFDWAWTEKKVALEIDGGIWTRGRHTRGAGYLKDVEKFNAAAVLGWRVIKCTPSEFRTLSVLTTLREVLG